MRLETYHGALVIYLRSGIQIRLRGIQIRLRVIQIRLVVFKFVSWHSNSSRGGQIRLSGIQICLSFKVNSRWPATSWVHYTTNCNTQSSAPEDG